MKFIVCCGFESGLFDPGAGVPHSSLRSRRRSNRISLNSSGCIAWATRCAWLLSEKWWAGVRGIFFMVVCVQYRKSIVSCTPHPRSSRFPWLFLGCGVSKTQLIGRNDDLHSRRLIESQPSPIGLTGRGWLSRSASASVELPVLNHPSISSPAALNHNNFRDATPAQDPPQPWP